MRFGFVIARTSPTMSSPTRRRNPIDSTAAISRTGGACGSGKIPWNGRTSGSVTLYSAAMSGWLEFAPASLKKNRRTSSTSSTLKMSVTTFVAVQTDVGALVPTLTFDAAGAVVTGTSRTCS